MSTEPSSSIKRVGAEPEGRFAEIAEHAKAAGKDVRVRCELRLLDSSTSSYRFWPQSYWTLDVPADVDTGMLVRDAFEAFITGLTKIGAQKVIERLTVTENYD